jgi:hypothetical protein
MHPRQITISIMRNVLALRFFRSVAWQTVACLSLLAAHLAEAQNSQFGFDANGNFYLQVSEISAAPTIIGQPQPQIVIPGQTASFAVVVADTQNLTYQWLFNGANINAANNDALLLTNVGTNNEGTYAVVITNGSGSVTSAPAALMIDSRGCGMSDSWQMTYFNNLTQNATGDFDSDGVSNLQEFLDGTNPTNTTSALYRIALFNDGGTVVAVPDQPNYTNGQVVTLTATGSGAAPFHAWTGDAVTRSNSITLTMTTNKTLFAHFKPITFQWTNAVNGDWNVASNWTPNLAPGSNDSVVIVNTVIVTLNSKADLADFTLGYGNIAPELTGTGALTIHGTGTWAGGTMSGAGTTVIAPGASFTFANPTFIVLSRTLENGGTALYSGGGVISINGGVITNDAGAQFLMQSPGSLNFGGGSPRFDNAGTLVTAANDTTAFVAVAFNNYGTVTIQGGTFSMSGGGVQAGNMPVPAGTTVNFAGGTFTSSDSLSITGAGTLIVSGGSSTLGGTINVTGSNIFSNGSVDFTGNYTCVGNTLLDIPGGTVNFNGSGVVAPTVLNLSGTLGGAQDVAVGSAMTWTAGSMNGTGRTIIPPSATLTVANPSFMTINNRTLDNRGTTFWSVPNLSFNGGVITNEPGALFQVQSPSSFNFGGGAPRFDNAGTFRATGAGTTTIGVTMNNFNVVDIQGGTLTLGSGGSLTGAITVPVGTALNFGGGIFTSSTGSSITGAGTLMVNFGQGTLGGTINVTGSNIFNNGSMGFSGNYICTNNTLVISGGAISFDGTGVVAPTVLNLIGTLGGAQDVTVGSAMTWTAGSMNGTGRTIIPPGATLNINNPSFITLTARTLDNAGTTTWSGANLIMDGSVITNRPGALFNPQNASLIQFGGGTPRFDNAGTFRKTGNAGTLTLASVGFTNYGTVDIQSGVLRCGPQLRHSRPDSRHQLRPASGQWTCYAQWSPLHQSRQQLCSDKECFVHGRQGRRA